MKKKGDMFVAEEVYKIVFELSRADLGLFRWKDYLRAYDAVYGRHWMVKNSLKSCGKGVNKGYLHMTLGNMIRAQLVGGRIKRMSRGRYAFTAQAYLHLPGVPARPLYVSSGDGFMFRYRKEFSYD